jgi:TetR/AcrR family transcriptional regulator
MATRRQTGQGRTPKKLGTRAQPEQTKAAILDAATDEFSREGLAGARTDSIARAAGVNKALLYYYFRDKESLYAAVLNRVFAGLSVRIEEALARPLPPRQRMLAYAATHFDYIAGNQHYPRLMSRELMRARLEKLAPAQKNVRRLVSTYFQPVFRRVSGLIEEGIESGDFRPVNPLDFMLTIVASIVFYFLATPVLQQVTGIDPLSPERISERRAAVLDFISAALFNPPVQAMPHPPKPNEGLDGAASAGRKRSRA